MVNKVIWPYLVHYSQRIVRQCDTSTTIGAKHSFISNFPKL